MAAGRKRAKETLPKSTRAGKEKCREETEVISTIPKVLSTGRHWEGAGDEREKRRERGKATFSSRSSTKFPELVASAGISVCADFGAVRV